MTCFKNLLLMLGLTCMMLACNNTKNSGSMQSNDMAQPASITLPYTPSYSSSFKIGNPDYATMIVQGSWKDWDDNNMDNLKNWMADTILTVFSNNETIRGIDSVTAIWKRVRANYSSFHTNLDAVIPVYSTDKKDNWVLVWTDVVGTRTDGTVDSASFMETWMINSAGKAAMLLQYDRANRKK